MGNNLSYRSHDLVDIGRRVEEVVRRDVGATASIPYRIIDGEAESPTLRTTLTDMRHLIGSGQMTTQALIVFDLPGPRPATLEIRMTRMGLVSHCGSILFKAQLRGSVDRVIRIGPHRSYGAPGFQDGPSADRLNAVKDLSKRVEKVARTLVAFGTVVLRRDQLFSIYPEDGHAVLVIGTLPRTSVLGGKATTDAKELLAIADAIDQAIR